MLSLPPQKQLKKYACFSLQNLCRVGGGYFLSDALITAICQFGQSIFFFKKFIVGSKRMELSL